MTDLNEPITVHIIDPKGADVYIKTTDFEEAMKLVWLLQDLHIPAETI